MNTLRQPDVFYFKKFSVRHDRCSMKVGTDGVLLGAWVNVTGCKSILDIGTGTGVIAMILAQRTETDPDTIIDAVELQKAAYEQACENVSNSPWPAKIRVHHYPIQTFTSDIRYDLIVSNPPYFQNSQAPPTEERYKTRHTITLSFTELLEAANRLLTASGRFAVILPVTEAMEFTALATSIGFFCNEKGNFKTRWDKPVKRCLLTFSKTSRSISENDLLLYKDDNNFTEEYRELTKDLYLWKN